MELEQLQLFTTKISCSLNTEKQDAFCGEALVEMKDGKVISLHNELPEGAVLVEKEVTKEAMKEWTLRAREKWNQ